MVSSFRLTCLCAASALLLALPGAAAAEPDNGTGSSDRAIESQAEPRSPQSPQERPAPSGCPYRNGKLELIV